MPRVWLEAAWVPASACLTPAAFPSIPKYMQTLAITSRMQRLTCRQRLVVILFLAHGLGLAEAAANTVQLSCMRETNDEQPVRQCFGCHDGTVAGPIDQDIRMTSPTTEIVPSMRRTPLTRSPMPKLQPVTVPASMARH